MGLGDRLHEFRIAKTVERFCHSILKDLGPSIIMPDDVLQCIVDCAHAQKITSVKTLAKETRWNRMDELGAEIIAIIRIYAPQTTAPLTPLTSAPLRTHPNFTNNALGSLSATPNAADALHGPTSVT
jgi:hypothetical protein